MQRKTPGKLNPPPPQAEFDRLPLNKWCQIIEGLFYRLHSHNPATKKPWPPLHFSQKGLSRFDPKKGVGTVCLAEQLAGALMEVFDDQWGPVGAVGRSLTKKQLAEYWVTCVQVSPVILFEASGPNLSKIGTDVQLLAGDHTIAREWALRFMFHPAQIDGVRYLSRHDNLRRNLALFSRPALLPAQKERDLHPTKLAVWSMRIHSTSNLKYGPAVRLRDHPHLDETLKELEVAIIP